MVTESRFRGASLRIKITAHLSAIFVVISGFLGFHALYNNFYNQSIGEEVGSNLFFESTSQLITTPGRDGAIKLVIAPSYVIDHRKWIHLNRGQKSDGFDFTVDGRLFYSNEMLSQNLPVTDFTRGGKSHWIYAQSVAISPLSPNKEFVIFYGCERKDLSGLCWATYLARLTNLQTERLRAGLKYGIKEWVAWFKDHDESAIVSSGENYYWRVHLPTGSSEQCDLPSCTIKRSRN
ncbi:hypothetical protein ACFL17_05745 [Pseudomonadota bacterium]